MTGSVDSGASTADDVPPETIVVFDEEDFQPHDVCILLDKQWRRP